MDSGNGSYRLFRIDLPNDDEARELVKRVLLGIAALLGPQERAGEPYATLDLGMFNASRIIRVAGPWNRKGDNMTDRPHRRAVLYPPVDECPVGVVPLDLLQDVAEMAPEPAQPDRPAAASTNGQATGRQSRLNVDRWLTDRHVEYRTKDRPGGRGSLVSCPFGSHGANGESAVWQNDEGKLTYECKHSSCADRRWADFRDAIGKPDAHHWDRPPGTPTELTTTPATAADGGPPAAKIDFGLITAAELLRKDCRVEYLVAGVLAKGQNTLLGGPLKACKSLLATDLAISLAIGGHFLGYFPVPRPVRTIYMNGEAGWPVFQENIRRISHRAGADEKQLENLLTGVRLPKFGQSTYMAALAETIQTTKTEVVFLDCAYRCIPGDNASNLFAMGELLDSIGRIFEELGATLVLLHHSPKHIPVGEPLQLDNLAFAGFAEFSASWLLVNRRTDYVPGSGHHELWLTTGGRAGHGGVFAVDADEGEFHEGRDRDWSASVRKPDEIRQGRQDERAANREAQWQAKIDEVKKRIIKAAAKYPKGETATQIRDRAGLHDREFKPALAVLLDDGEMTPCEIQKANRKKPYPGYILTVNIVTTQG